MALHWGRRHSGKEQLQVKHAIPLLIVGVKLLNMCAFTKVYVPSLQTLTVLTFLLLNMRRALRYWPKLPWRLNALFKKIIIITTKHTLNSHSNIIDRFTVCKLSFKNENTVEPLLSGHLLSGHAPLSGHILKSQIISVSLNCSI